jgi:hypothetical protein
MTEPESVVGRKPIRVIPEDRIGKLEMVPETGADQEAGGRTSRFWLKCWSCDKFLARPLSPPSYEAYTCPYCGAVNEI